MAKVELVAIVDSEGNRDGEAGYRVEVDGKVVIDHIRSSDLDIGTYSLNPLWKALGVTVEFDYE